MRISVQRIEAREEVKGLTTEASTPPPPTAIPA
jgi:hypothetical protein